MDCPYFNSNVYNLSSSLVIRKYKSELHKDVLLHIVGFTKQHTINSTYKHRDNRQYQVIKNQYQNWPALPSAIDVDIKMPKEVTHTGLTKCPLSDKLVSFSRLPFLGGKGKEVRKGETKCSEPYSGPGIWPLPKMNNSTRLQTFPHGVGKTWAWWGLYPPDSTQHPARLLMLVHSPRGVKKCQSSWEYRAGCL